MFTEGNLQLLDRLSGNRMTTAAMIRGEWIGGGIGAGTAGGATVHLAQATGGTMTLPQGGGGQTLPLPRTVPGGGVRIGPWILTVEQLLREVQASGERRQVEDAMQRFNLNRADPVDILAARAYVWTRNMAPLTFFTFPASGEVNERAARMMMEHERGNPGTLGLASRGDPSAQAAVRAIIDAAMAGQAIPTAGVFARTSQVHGNLSTTSRAAWAALGLRNPGMWQAHHLIPFAVVAAMPANVQLAIAASGWVMDSAENLIALPANWPTYVGPYNRTILPIHNTSHSIYSTHITGQCAALIAMAPRGAHPAIRAELLRIEDAGRSYLRQKLPQIHPRLR